MTNLNKSQSLFLTAVLLGGQRVVPPRVLRSSLYPIPVTEVSQAVVSLSESPFNSKQTYYDVSKASTEVIFEFQDVRQDYEHPDTDTLALAMDLDVAITYTGTREVDYAAYDTDTLALNMDLDVAITAYAITYVDHTAYDTDTLALTMDLDIAVTVS